MSEEVLVPVSHGWQGLGLSLKRPFAGISTTALSATLVLAAPTAQAEDEVAANGADLTTAEGSTIRFAFDGTTMKLRDKDTNRVNPNVILARVDINAGNNQVAHPINGVLLPKLG